MKRKYDIKGELWFNVDIVSLGTNQGRWYNGTTGAFNKKGVS